MGSSSHPKKQLEERLQPLRSSKVRFESQVLEFLCQEECSIYCMGVGLVFCVFGLD